MLRDLSPRQLGTIECQKDGLDPEAPFIDEKGETYFLSEKLGYWTNLDQYELFVEGFSERPTQPRRN